MAVAQTAMEPQRTDEPGLIRRAASATRDELGMMKRMALGAGARVTGEDISGGTVRQADTVLAAVTIGIIAVLGILIYDQVATTAPAPENENLSDSQNQTTEGFGNAMEFVPIILIVLMAAVVLGVVQRMRR